MNTRIAVTAGTNADMWTDVVDAVGEAQRRLLENVSRLGISEAEFVVLRQLLRADGHRLPMSRLARQVSFTSGGFTKLADRMGRGGLIDRRNSASDRRVVFATLTPAGLTTALECERAYAEAVEREVVPYFDHERLDELSALLGQLRAALAPTAALEVVEPSSDVVAVSSPRDPALPDRRRRPGAPEA